MVSKQCLAKKRKDFQFSLQTYYHYIENNSFLITCLENEATNYKYADNKF